MKSYSQFSWPRTIDVRQEQQRNSDLMRVKGDSRLPPPPTNLLVYKNGTVISVSWNAPVDSRFNIAGYRVYLDTESNRIQAINDPGTTSTTITIVASTNHNVFVSCVNPAGKESPLVHKQI